MQIINNSNQMGGNQMPFDEAQAQQMDEAASKALAEIKESISSWSANDLIKWWRKWYLKAGHKRLGRILVALDKKT
jgi:predicted ATPase